jgi:indole-3-acetate monooxygenase
MAGLKRTDSDLLVDAARGLSAEVFGLRAEIEHGRRLPVSLVEKMRGLQLFELWLPRAFGGCELHPIDFVRVVEELSRADGSVGWCTSVANVFCLLAGNLPDHIAREIFGNRNIVAGTVNPSGKAVATSGGYQVTGQWGYGTGIDFSSWVVGNCIIFDGEAARLTGSGAPEMRMAFLRRDEVEVLDTWNVVGMRGTGSHDFRVRDRFVPIEYSLPAFVSAPTRPGILFQTPLISLFVVSLAAVSLGIARAALDALQDLASAKKPMGSTVLLRDKPMTQVSIGRAESLVRAARASVFDAINQQWDEIARGETPSLRNRASIRLACTYAGEACAQAVDIVYNVAAGSALYESGRIERCFRDIHAATQHIGLTANNYELAGRVLLGLDPGTPRF